MAETADPTVDDDNKSDSEYEYEYEEIEVEVDEEEIVDETGKVRISEGQCTSSKFGFFKVLNKLILLI